MSETIEFMGPPGAGKSTLFGQLSQTRQWYSPYPKGISELESTLPSLTPMKLKLPIYKLWWHLQLKNDFFYRFAGRNPPYLSLMGDAVEAVDSGEQYLVYRLKEIASRHELGAQTADQHDEIAFDELFCQGYLSIRKRNGEIDPEVFFNVAPIPDMVIYVDAELDICRKRITSRKGEVGGELPDQAVQAIERMSDAATELADVLEDRDVNVCRISNNGELSDALSGLFST